MTLRSTQCQLYEIPAASLGKLLEADSAARAGLAPGADDASAELAYAAARLKYLLSLGLEQSVRCSGWPQPRDASEAFGELARLTEQVSALVGQADCVIGRELRDGRLTPASTAATGQGGGRAASTAELEKRLEPATAARAGLDQAAAQLRRLQLRAGRCAGPCKPP